MDTLSKRGRNNRKEGRVDMELFFDAVQDLYEPVQNPGGKFVLNVAENIPMTSTIQEKVEDIISKGIPEWTFQYTSPQGHLAVREQVAAFMQKHFRSEMILPETIVLSAGAAASLEVLSFVVADDGDVVAIPAPAYPMYTADLGVKSGMVRHDVQTHYHIEGLKDLAIININHLRETLHKIQEDGKKFKMLLLTSPDNPTGSVYDLGELTYMAEWCTQHHVHLVVNEIYHLSRISDEDNPELTSFAQVIEKMQSPYLHLIYGMSKDFAMSGMRVGIIHTLNRAVLEALNAVNIPHMVSNITQFIIGELLSDQAFISTYLKRNRMALYENYSIVSDTLSKLHLPYVKSAGSLFVWADLSRYIPKLTAYWETKLWTDIYKGTGVLLTPGTGFGHEKHGLFRIVFSAENAKGLQVAMDRLARFLSDKDIYKHEE